VATVLNVAYPFAPVTTDSVGGAEQVLARLDAALTAAGHRSVVLARAGSVVSGELVPIEVPEGTLTPALRSRVLATVRAQLEALLAQGGIDLVHLHGVDCAEYLPPASVPRVVTLHLPPEWYPRTLYESRDGPLLICVSKSQRARCPASRALVIENGVDLERWCPLPSAAHGSAVCLGRICAEKGFDVALTAARAAGVPLVLAGEVFPYPEHQAYFVREIEPLLDDRRRFVGPVFGKRKHELLAGACAVLVPSRVPETSSLVTMEALACGTPAIVSGRGALASLVETGRTGFVAEGATAMSAALGQAQHLDRAECRRHAERRFDGRVMERRYLLLYDRITAAPNRGAHPTLEELGE